MIWNRPLGAKVLCLIFIQSIAGAKLAQARQDLVPGSRYTSARAAAMGDAFLPLGEDGASALFYNPAAVGKIRAFTAEPVNFSAYGNGGLTDAFGLNTYKAISLSSNYAQLQATPGAYQGLGASLLPNVSGKGFAFGVLMQSEVGATSDAYGNVHYRSLYQVIPAAAFGVRLAGGIVRLGYGIQWVNQAVGDISVPTGTSPLGYNQLLPQGSGFSHTLGFALTMPITYLPSLNLVGRNLMGTSFNGPSLIPFAANSPGSPASEQMTFDASFSLQPKIDSGVYMNYVFELRDLTNRSGVALLGRACTGLELSFRDVFYVRGGWGDGYPSAGIGLRRKNGEFSMTWLSEEIGYAYQSVRDIRFLLQFQVRAF